MLGWTWLLDLVAAEPYLTLDDIRVRLSRVNRLKVGSILALLRSSRDHVQRKLCTPPSRIGQMLRLRALR
jgi:hypothetical protein